MPKLWKLTTGRRHMSDEERAECIQLYMDGAKLRVLSERYDRKRPVISRLIAAAGVKRGHKFRGIKPRDPYLFALQKDYNEHYQ
jgi:hypothetical protein